MNLVASYLTCSKLATACRGAEKTITPLYLAREMVSEVPEDAIRYPLNPFLDPCAGTGTTLVALYERLIKYHSHNFIVEELLHGWDTSAACCQSMKRIGLKNVEKRDFLAYNGEMKFSVVVCNPPYNLASSSTSTNHKQKTKFIGKDFLEWIPTISEIFAVVICPTKGYWVGKNHNSTKKRLKKLGLFKVEFTDAFKNAIKLEGIGVYYFSKGYEGDIEDDFNVGYNKIDNNLGRLLQYGSSELIAGNNKKQTFLPGTDTFYITPTRDVIRDIDCSEIKDPTKGNWRVILSQNASKDNYGTPILIKPGDAITYSVVCFAVKSKEQGELLIDYLNSDKIKLLAKPARSSATNSKHSFSTIPIPEFMQ